jgi:hypothetical protein
MVVCVLVDFFVCVDELGALEIGSSQDAYLVGGGVSLQTAYRIDS